MTANPAATVVPAPQKPVTSSFVLLAPKETAGRLKVSTSWLANPYASVPLNAELFDDVGIRRYVANKKGGFDVSFHPDGDLYFRMVQHNKGHPSSR